MYGVIPFSFSYVRQNLRSCNSRSKKKKKNQIVTICFIRFCHVRTFTSMSRTLPSDRRDASIMYLIRNVDIKAKIQYEHLSENCQPNHCRSHKTFRITIIRKFEEGISYRANFIQLILSFYSRFNVVTMNGSSK